MEYALTPMTGSEANQILTWHYPPPYSFYDMNADIADCRDFLLAVENQTGEYYSAWNSSHELSGFFSFLQQTNLVEIGLGLKPDLTGQGFGYSFVSSGVQFAVRTFHPEKIRLAVATFNQRAITLYQRMGFEVTSRYLNHTNGGQYEFLEMILDLP